MCSLLIKLSEAQTLKVACKALWFATLVTMWSRHLSALLLSEKVALSPFL